MEYFKIEYEDKESIVGTNWNQITLGNAYPKNSLNSIYELTSKNYGSFDLHSTGIILAKGSIPTDFMHQVFCTNGIIVSQNVKDILQDYPLPSHRFFPLSLNYKKKPFKAYLLYISMDILDYVLWSESEFLVRNGLMEERIHKISNRSDYDGLGQKVNFYHNKKKTLLDSSGMPKPGFIKQAIQLDKDSITFYRYKNLTLNKFISKFSLINESSNFYVSKSLKDQFEKSNVSGIKMKSTPALKIKSGNIS